MRNALIAASALLGSASAGVHHMKLEKVPLDQQLTAASMAEHARALGHKYSQKFLGNSFNDGIYRHQAIGLDKDHDVPVENFLNAQCTL